jgi:hypothetical protein
MGQEVEHGGYTKDEYDQTSARWELVGAAHAGRVSRLLIRHVDGQLCAAYADWRDLEKLDISKIGRLRLLYQYDGAYWTIFPEYLGKRIFIDCGYIQPLAAEGNREIADFEGIHTLDLAELDPDFWSQGMPNK